MPPQNLQIGPPWQNGVPSFAQQGQIDWVGFGNTVWNISAAMLQRFAGSGIQPVTYGAGLALASRFRMSNSGRQRMDQAMRSLRGVPGLDKILWFGFGHQSFVKMMGDNQLGLNCIALCACLTEVHSEETAARVLESLWNLNEFPEHYEPSHAQFCALVKACSGTVCRSRFGKDLDAMTGHGRWPFGPYQGEHDHRHPLRASNAIDIARALDALFQITRGEVETITLLGQNECAFIAAFAHWLFDFTIYVEDEAEEVLFRSYEDLNREDAQVFVRYTKKEEPTALKQKTTFILPVGTDILSKFYADSESRWIWKVPWDECLLRTFGSRFRDLSGLSNLLGVFLGGTARIYAALATGEPKVANFSRHRFIDFTQLSYGQGYIHSVTSIFKELERISGLHDAMESALNSSFDNACQKVEEAAQSLRNMCHCRLCAHDISVTTDSDYGSSGNCFFTLAMTIRSLVTVLACTNRDEALSAAVYGLQSYYEENEVLHRTWIEKDGPRSLVAIATGLASVTDPDDTLVRKPERLLDEIQRLFDGSLPVGYFDGPSLGGNTANSSNGICYYRECLKGISSKAAAMRVIHVIPGHIERGTAQYDAVSDGGLYQKSSAALELANIIGADSSDPKHTPINVGKIEVKALARESSTYRKLHLHYKIILPNGSVTHIEPSWFSNQVLERTGILTCYRGKKCKQQLAFPCSTVQSGWFFEEKETNLHYNAGRVALCLWEYHEDLARCVVFDLQNVYGVLNNQTTFLRQDECLPCSSETILRESSSIIKAAEDERAVAHVI